MKTKHLLLAASILLVLASLSFGHLPSLNDASLQMGRISVGDPSRSRADAVDTFKNLGVWDSLTTYRGDYTIRRGDTVSHGTFNGKKLWWWAKFYAAGAEFEPGYFAPQGGTSPWVLVNSLSAVATGTQNYVWAGWNGDMDNLGSMQAGVPTWRDGAEGAYSFTHDDIGAMPFDLSVQPAWELGDSFPDIKSCWGVYVEKMSGEEWELARSMVVDGHEMFNHSMEHTSAADQWQWFFPGQKVPSHDPAIPEALRGLDVVGTWGNPDKGPVYPYVGDGTRIFESPMVAIRATHYWSQNAPSTESVGKDLGAPYGVVIEPEIYLKPGVQEIILENTQQKQYVKYDVYDSSAEPSHSGQIAATGPTWLELAKLEEYGGQFWLPSKPYYPGTPITWSWGEEWKFVPGQVITYNGIYYTVISTNQGTDTPDKDPSKYIAYPEYNPSDPAASISSQGSYIGSNWSSTTEDTTEKWSVDVDKGAPGFVAKVWCVKKWTGPEYKLNIQDANDSINKHIYEGIVTSAHHFRKGKRSEYFGYPFDAYSEITHDSLEQAGFVGARGGAKSGQPIPGDFFHPYRIDFDAFYITDPSYTESSSDSIHLYPNNPHVLLGMNEMVDSIISQKGYMIREFHAVADISSSAWYNTSDPSEQWPLNSAAKGVGGWWGGVPKYMLKAHYEYIDQKIKNHELVVYTVGEITKYRLTANATSGATVTKAGADYEVTATTAETIAEKYQDEISIIVSLDAPADSMNAYYKSPDASWGDTPRRRPVKMDAAGTKWSVSMQPYLGTVVLEPNAAWTGPGVELDSGVTPVGALVSAKAQKISFAGIQSGTIALQLPVGAYTAQIFNAQGRLVRSANFSTTGGLAQTGLRTSSMSNGLYFIQVKQAGVQVLQDKFIVR